MLININRVFEKKDKTSSVERNKAQLSKKIYGDIMRDFINNDLKKHRDKLLSKRFSQWKSPFQVFKSLKPSFELPCKINKTVVDSFDGTSISTMSKVGLAPVSISKRRQTTQENEVISKLMKSISPMVSEKDQSDFCVSRLTKIENYPEHKAIVDSSTQYKYNDNYDIIDTFANSKIVQVNDNDSGNIKRTRVRDSLINFENEIISRNAGIYKLKNSYESID